MSGFKPGEDLDVTVHIPDHSKATFRIRESRTDCFRQEAQRSGEVLARRSVATWLTNVVPARRCSTGDQKKKGSSKKKKKVLATTLKVMGFASNRTHTTATSSVHVECQELPCTCMVRWSVSRDPSRARCKNCREAPSASDQGWRSVLAASFEYLNPSSWAFLPHGPFIQSPNTKAWKEEDGAIQ